AIHLVAQVSDLCSTGYRRSLTPFLPATVLRGPLRVRAFVLVRWPRHGRFLRCRSPRYALISFRRAMLLPSCRRSGPSPRQTRPEPVFSDLWPLTSHRWDQPCRCLCRGSSQITRTTPLRLISLHFSQIRRTLDRTFMVHLFRKTPYDSGKPPR